LSIIQTVLVFVGSPAVVIAAVFAAVYGTSARRSDKRYRPGRPFTFEPVWFLAGPGRAPAATARVNGTAVLGRGPGAPELTAGGEAGDVEPDAPRGEVGGASDNW